MTTLTATYCAFCDIVAKAWKNIIDFVERTGRSRAAAELARQGYYKEAKRLMLEVDNNK